MSVMKNLLKVMNKTKIKSKKRMIKKVKIKSNEDFLFYFIVLTVYIFTKSFFFIFTPITPHNKGRQLSEIFLCQLLFSSNLSNIHF